MKLDLFLGIIVALLPLLLVLCYNEKRLTKSPMFYFLILAVATLLSYLTFAYYAKSKGDDYKNTDYHIIQQDGYKYAKGKTLYLASDNSPDSALLATAVGELWLDPALSLHVEGFKLPLYVEDSAGNTDNFQVVNALKELSMNNGDELKVVRQTVIKVKDKSHNANPRRETTELVTDTLLKIKYEEVVEKGAISKYRFVFSTSGTLQDNVRVYDTVYETRFRQGLSLTNLLQNGIKTRLDVTAMDLFGNCYMIRDHYKLDKVVSSDTPKESAPVFLFVDDKLNNDSCFFYINGTKVTPSKAPIVVADMQGRQFYYGLGETKSTVYRVSIDGDDVFLKYRLPKMCHFPDFDTTGPTKMYMTTDVNDIINHDRNSEYKYSSYYQFAEQLTNDNIYKASAVLDFNIDKAGVSFSPIYADNYNDIQTAAREITPGSEFTIQSASYRRNTGVAQVSYVFKILDMRDNRVYQNAKYLYIAMLVLFAIVFWMIGVISARTHRAYSNKLFILETSIYLVLIAFLTVRLVLLWRLHAMPPIDHVSYLEFNKLTDPAIFSWTFYGVIGFLLLRIILLVLQWLTYNNPNITFSYGLEKSFDGMAKTANSTRKIARIQIGTFKVPTWWVVVAIIAPLLLYGLCLLLTKFEISRVVAKEAIAPLVMFFFNSIFIVLLMRSKDKLDNTAQRNLGIYCWTSIVLNTAMFVVFLFVAKELGMVFPLLAVFGIWFFIVAILSTEYFKDRLAWKTFLSIVLLIGLCMVFLHVPIEQKPWGKKVMSAMPIPSRIRARMETLSYTPTEMMQNKPVKFKEESLQEIRNASSNKWFIDNHLIQRNRIEDNAKGKVFNVNKDYNQQAVSYEVQTRDVLLLRYVIYEHGRGVARKLIWILFMLTFTVFVIFRRKAPANGKLSFLQQLPLQSSLYLLLFSAYLYLVNTNAVVFVGLDFPFLTLTSKVAPLGLLLPLLAMLLPVNMRRLEDAFTPNVGSSKMDSRKLTSGIVSLLLMIGFIGFPSRLSKNAINGKNDSTYYCISMEPLAEFINNYLNPRFKEYQETTSEGKAMASKSIDNKKLKDYLQSFLGEFNDPNSTFESALADFNQKTKHKINSDEFIRSTFEYLMHTSLTNTSSILHVRKMNGQFVFVTNKVFYDMKPLFDNGIEDPWHGDLLAAASASRLSFLGEDGKVRNLRRSDRLYKFIDESANKDYFCDKENNASFYLYQIPSKYCYGEENDVFVMVCNNVTDRFKLSPNDDPTCAFYESMGLRVLPNDVIKVGNAKKSFSIVTEGGHYFAKRIHYNGKHQVIYPLGNKFMFAYNFDQMLADSYKSKSPDAPIRISLDYDLLTEVQEYCDSTIRSDNKLQRRARLPLRFGDGITVTAIDGNGRIRLLADYNPNKMMTTDPNQSKEVKRIMDSIYLNGDNDLERKLLQNRNISRMPVGPGSTIKVPFYVAMMSTVDLPWEKLGIGFPSNLYKSATNIRTKKSRDLVHYFGPDEVLRKHGLADDEKGWDEMAGEYSNNAGSILSPNDFIATSNNFYFGSILMLGSYDVDKLNGGLGGVLEKSSSDEKVFPKFVIDRKNYYRFKNKYLKELSENPFNSALESGLLAKFHFNLSEKSDNLISSYDRQPVEDVLGLNKDEVYTGMNALYVYSILPRYRNYIRGRSMEHKQDIYDKHLNLTSGGVQKMDVTPLNMAEMYLRVALQNGYEGSILTYKDDAQACRFDSLSTINGFQDQMKSVTYLGMWNVIRQGGALHGTLVGCVGKELTRRLNKDNDRIYLYGKTGTAGTSEQTNNNYHYAFILSNKALHVEDYNPEGLKIYIVYFGYYNGTLGHSGTTKTRDDILLKIINSETFRDYWYETNSDETNE